MADIYQESLELHTTLPGKISVETTAKVKEKKDLALLYSPGVAQPCKEIAKNPADAYKYTIKANTVAVISNGTAVLGLGNIGPLASLPVMEGKCLLFKEFGGINAFPLCLETDDMVKTVRAVAPVFGGINLEDIKAPECFEIEEQLQDLGIPVFHDDQHGTAVVTYAGLINALKLVNKSLDDVTIVINGAGAAGIAIAKMIPAKNIILCDSKGIIHKERTDLNSYKQKMLEITNKENLSGTLADAVKSADVFVGVSVAGALTQEMVKSMADDPIIFGLANPVPEIMPDEAKAAGAKIVATGRSDLPNQVNNVLAFPGIFKGALEAGATRITEEMKEAAAYALAKHVGDDLTVDRIIPNALDKGVAEVVAQAVKEVAQQNN